jgi:VanZ family protein
MGMSEHEKWAARWRALIKAAAWWFFWPAVAVIAWGELKPNSGEEGIIWDKALHFTAYFGLAWLGTLAWGRRVRPLLILAVVLALGGILEILQGMVGRDGEWGDMLANTLGGLAGMGLALLMFQLVMVVDKRRGD